MSLHLIRRTSALAAATLALGAVAIGAGNANAAESGPVIVFFTQCDETSASATVKIKRINEDGTDPVTIGDTGIAHCSNSGTPTVFHTGFAVAGEYGYFGRQKSDDSGTGIGRIRLDGTSAPERDFVSVPLPAKSLQLSPRSVGGNLYFYADDGYADQYSVANPRIMKASTSGGAATVVIQPTAQRDGDPVNFMSFGVGKDALYMSTNEMQSMELVKVSFSGVRSAYFTFADSGPDGITMEFLNGGGANLIAESDDTMFLYSKSKVDQKLGLSTVQTAQLTTSLQVGKAVPGVVMSEQDGGPQFQVWGGNYLYFKNGTGKQISRTTKTGALEDNVFPSIVKTGWIHHISPARASTVTIATTTSTTSSTAAQTTTTTVAPTTTVPKLTVPKNGGLAGVAVARYLGMKIPKGAKVGIKVAAPSSKVCAVRRSKLVALKSGNCRVTATVTPKKGKSTRKSTTIAIP